LSVPAPHANFFICPEKPYQYTKCGKYDGDSTHNKYVVFVVQTVPEKLRFKMIDEMQIEILKS